MAEPLISISAAAREIGLNKSTLSRQIKAGSIRSHDGMVRLSEVLEDRANNIDAAVWENRRRKTPGEALHATQDKPLHATVEDGDEAGTVLIDGVALPISKAKALKETYHARLRKLEFEVKSGSLVEAEAVHRAVFELSRQDRDAWSNWPAQVSPLMASELGIDQVALAVILERYVREHLAERSRSAPLRIAS